MATRVAVASGGRSLEREVSLRSGGRAADALGALGYDVTVLDPDARFVRRIRELAPDFVFVAMHGRGGEDGTLQDLLEILGVPYTGSDVHASGALPRQALVQAADAGAGTRHAASGTRSTARRSPSSARPRASTSSREQLGLPVRAEAGAPGLVARHQVRRDAGASSARAILGALGYDDRVLIERYVSGRELAVTVLGPDRRARGAAGDRDRRPRSRSTPSARTTTPARRRCARPSSTPRSPRARASRWPRRPTRAAGCRDLGRVDLILDEEGVPQILEINTIPGLTETGPTRYAAQAAGMEFKDLIARVISRVTGS